MWERHQLAVEKRLRQWSTFNRANELEDCATEPAPAVDALSATPCFLRIRNTCADYSQLPRGCITRSVSSNSGHFLVPAAVLAARGLGYSAKARRKQAWFPYKCEFVAGGTRASGRDFRCRIAAIRNSSRLQLLNEAPCIQIREKLARLRALWRWHAHGTRLDSG